MGRIHNFAEFNQMNEGLSTKDAKQTIKDMFDKFDGIVDDKYLKNMWKGDSTLRNLYGKELFDKAWDELIDAGTISTEDGKEWCWCAGKKKKELVEESLEEVNEKLDGEELLSPKQRKLPEGLKKGIIAKLKKQKPKKDEDDDECEDKKDKDCKDDDKEDKDDKKKTGSDEEKYLTPKQRKLPEGLKKGIIARAKKNAK